MKLARFAPLLSALLIGALAAPAFAQVANSTVIPEPGEVGLLLLGVAGLVIGRAVAARREVRREDDEA